MGGRATGLRKTRDLAPSATGPARDEPLSDKFVLPVDELYRLYGVSAKSESKRLRQSLANSTKKRGVARATPRLIVQHSFQARKANYGI
jgi:hypothetical protein